MERKILALLFALLCATNFDTQAQAIRDDLSYSLHGWYGYDIEQTRPNLTSYGYMTYEGAVGIQTTPEKDNYYDYLFGYPLLNFGVSVASMGDFRFSDQTKFPNLYSLYGSFERSLVRRDWFSAGYQLDFGLTYNPTRYDPVGNPGNNWLSSPVMAYFGAGGFAKIHLGKRWEIGADVMFRHYSNGRIALPNEALNAVGGGLFARYRLFDYDPRRYRTPATPISYERGMQYNIAIGGGVHTCMAEWNALVEREPDPAKREQIKLKAHPKLSLGFEALYRYSLRYATGLNVEMFYSSNMKELEASDRIIYGDAEVDNSPGYKPLSLGLAVVQEVYWHNLAVHVAVGAYPYRHKGVNSEVAKEAGDRERGWHYEKAGIRYYIPNRNAFVGFSIKSHSIKAEYLEFSFGFKL